MADPFSITGSAVGVVSLAIQLCKGLEWYVSGIKDAKDKAERIAADTEELTNLLQLLETIVAKVDPSQSVSTTLTGIASCAEAIATIRKKLKLDNQAVHGGIKSSLKRLGKRMAFPFKDAEIEYWKGVLNTIQQSLQTALLALVIDQQRLAFEGTRLFYTQLSVGHDTHYFSNLQLQHNLFNQTRLQLSGQSQAIETGFTATSDSLRRLHTDIHSLQAKLNEAMSATASTIEADVTNMRSVQRGTRTLGRRAAKVRCTCQPQTHARDHQLGWFSITCAQTLVHEPRCQQRLLQDAVTELEIRATFCSLILGRKVSLAFMLSYGAELSVTQDLHCHRVVPESSPAFALVRTLVESSDTMREEAFCREVDRLLLMFQHRQASPHDRLTDGNTLLHHLCSYAGRLAGSYSIQPHFRNTDNLRYLLMVLLAQMPAEASETNDQGCTCADEAFSHFCIDRLPILADFVTTLLKHDLKITWEAVYGIVAMSEKSPAFAKIPFENFTDLLLEDDGLIEAILSKSDDQLRHVLHQTETLQDLDGFTVVNALKMATANGWIDGCKIMLEADMMAYLDEESMEYNTMSLLTCSRGAGRLDMVQFWLLWREKFEGLRLQFIGCVEDLLYFNVDYELTYSTDLVLLVSEYIRNVRWEIKVLVEEHGIKYCCDSARDSLPDAHVRCMLDALMTKGISIAEHYWPKAKSLYYSETQWGVESLLTLETLSKAGFTEVTQGSFECGTKICCSPLLYLATQGMGQSRGAPARKSLTERDLIVRWFLSRGAELTETWPGSNTTATHCLAQQSASHLKIYLRRWHLRHKSIMEMCWTREDFDFLLQEEILDGCICTCCISGCDFVSCFWKEIFADSRLPWSFSTLCDYYEDEIWRSEMGRTSTHAWRLPVEAWPYLQLLHELTRWIDHAATTFQLQRLVSGYIRLFVFSYLELRHTCCNIKPIRHHGDPDHTKQPHPQYTSRETKRIFSEDAHLHAVLEEVVPTLKVKYDAVGEKLQDFVVGILIPTMRKTAKDLREEDDRLYAAGRRELGVMMYEGEDEDEQSGSGEEEEDQAGDVEEESDEEY